MRIDIDRVSKTYQAGTGMKITALDSISLRVDSGEFICIVGPSGCGKSTLLKLIGGIEQPDAGAVRCDDVPVGAPSTDRGFIFQDYALFPWLTVRQNIAFGLTIKGCSRQERKLRIDEYLRFMGLTGAGSLYPGQLSGGMRQRVALARALCLRPKLLLMDEPFAALDVLLRQRLQEELVRIWQTERMTYLLVTHDVEEALFLADRIVIMSPHPGRIRSILPIKLARPRRRTSAEFIHLRQHIMQLLEVGTAEAREERTAALVLP
ncbi:ABC transporter ATP-binding protein [Paenibacillus oenotherae]|uniref:ABC transporter ATP-binding protein n=1 Tax=Paenibacillus oenotherae TaxID=1435645 RepID=A0ABS7D7X0_9BACL|nr:ABC transporter ATP-binding protein [Paenibacillus oenotherae]MBW7476043.1 ABC transporter ATP-binding protein [Paenibacillus oenotherae]